MFACCPLLTAIPTLGGLGVIEPGADHRPGRRRGAGVRRGGGGGLPRPDLRAPHPDRSGDLHLPGSATGRGGGRRTPPPDRSGAGVHMTGLAPGRRAAPARRRAGRGGAVVPVLAALPVDPSPGERRRAASSGPSTASTSCPSRWSGRSCSWATCWWCSPRRLAAALRRWRLAAGLLVGGAATYLLAKAVKGIVVRWSGRTTCWPTWIRGAEAHGRGFVPGHAVATALVVVAYPDWGSRGRVLCAVLAAAVCLEPCSRRRAPSCSTSSVGAGWGLAVAGLVRLLLGRRI